MEQAVAEQQLLPSVGQPQVHIQVEIPFLYILPIGMKYNSSIAK